MILDQKGSLHLCGFRTSFALAQMFHIMIQRLRPRAFLLDPQVAMMPDALVDIAPADLLLAVFRYPYARQTVRIARQFAAAGARTLLVTDSAFSPLSDLATLQIVVSSEGLSIFRDFTAVTAVLETLHLAVLQLCDKSLTARLEAGEALFREFGTYWQQGQGEPPGKPPRPGR
jgi:DNA-binding MurR/RpiR family transcriptional regulator